MTEKGALDPEYPSEGSTRESQAGDGNVNRKAPAASGEERDGLRMSRDAMLDLACRAAELLVERIERLPTENAWDGEFRQGLADLLMKDPPESGQPARQVIERAALDILPLAVRNDHPRFFGFIPSSPTWPSVVADFMAAGFHVNQCTWLTSSGPSQLELVVIDWFRRWVGYPESAGGLLTSGGSAATLDAFVAAREAAGHPEGATVYMSDQSHSAQVRAAKIIGVRPDHVRMVATDGRFRLDMESLAGAVADDRAAGLNPIAVCANAGAGSTGAIDPLSAMADYCEAEGIWFHVDAAYGGFGMVTEKGKRLMRGIERADSIGLDAHKWFFQPYEAGCLLVKESGRLENAFRIPHDMLQDTIWGGRHPNFSDRGLQLSRSVRALKIWISVQIFGMTAFRQAISRGMDLASRAQEFIEGSPVLEVLNPASLGIVCFRVNPAASSLDETALEEVNRTVLARIFWEDRAFISSTRLRGRFSLRMCIVNDTTTWDDVRETLESAERFGSEAVSAGKDS